MLPPLCTCPANIGPGLPFSHMSAYPSLWASPLLLRASALDLVQDKGETKGPTGTLSEVGPSTTTGFPTLLPEARRQ